MFIFLKLILSASESNVAQYASASGNEASVIVLLEKPNLINLTPELELFSEFCRVVTIVIVDTVE